MLVKQFDLWKQEASAAGPRSEADDGLKTVVARTDVWKPGTFDGAPRGSDRPKIILLIDIKPGSWGPASAGVSLQPKLSYRYWNNCFCKQLESRKFPLSTQVVLLPRSCAGDSLTAPRAKIQINDLQSCAKVALKVEFDRTIGLRVPVARDEPPECRHTAPASWKMLLCATMMPVPPGFARSA